MQTMVVFIYASLVLGGCKGGGFWSPRKLACTEMLPKFCLASPSQHFPLLSPLKFYQFGEMSPSPLSKTSESGDISLSPSAKVVKGSRHPSPCRRLDGRFAEGEVKLLPSDMSSSLIALPSRKFWAEGRKFCWKNLSVTTEFEWRKVVWPPDLRREESFGKWRAEFDARRGHVGCHFQETTEDFSPLSSDMCWLLQNFQCWLRNNHQCHLEMSPDFSACPHFMTSRTSMSPCCQRFQSSLSCWQPISSALPRGNISWTSLLLLKIVPCLETSLSSPQLLKNLPSAETKTEISLEGDILEVSILRERWPSALPSLDPLFSFFTPLPILRPPKSFALRLFWRPCSGPIEKLSGGKLVRRSWRSRIYHFCWVFLWKFIPSDRSVK